MNNELTQEEKDKFIEGFSKFDKSGMCKIPIKELGNVIKSLGYNPTKSHLQFIIEILDADNNEKINMTIFIDVMKMVKSPFTKEELMKFFKEYDEDGEQIISMDDVKSIMLEQENDVDLNKLNLMENSGLDEDSKTINFKDFVKIMMLY